MVNKAVRGLAGAVALMGLLALVLEVAYRSYLFPFYRPELRTFNTEAALQRAEAGPVLLAMGDSFTAGFHTYPNLMAPHLPAVQVINAGVGGTGVVEAALMAEDLFDRYKPLLLLYQVYAGNDLLNYQVPADGQGVSWMRTWYWAASNHMRSLPFLNYRFGQWVAGLQPLPPDSIRVSPLTSTTFDPQTYTRNERLYLNAFPTFIADQILLRGSYATAIDGYLEHLQRLLRHCRPAACTAFVLVIPHKAQVTPAYRAQMETLGARFPEGDSLQAAEYPFLRKIRQSLGAQDVAQVHIINTLPDMQALEQAGTPVFAGNDLHLNAAGQRLLADLAVQALKGQGATPLP